jgi:protein arginine kinase activator
MLCMKCKKNEASYYYKQNINGRITETALCEECAGELGKNVMADTLSINPFGGLFGLTTPPRRTADTVKRCTLCGSGFGDLVKSGKIGCAKCYEVFADELSATVAKLHGQATHTGRAPLEHRAKNERRDHEKQLRGELKKAIDAQNFERAAVLRDELKKLDAGE